MFFATTHFSLACKRQKLYSRFIIEEDVAFVKRFFRKGWIFSKKAVIMGLMIKEAILLKALRSLAALVMTCLFCLAVLPVTAAATVTLTVSTAAAAPGDTVTVSLSASQIDGLAAIGVHLVYDDAVLECLEATAQGLMKDMDMNEANTEPIGYSSQVWLTGMSLKGVSGSGEIMTVTFRVKDDAPEGMTTIGFADDYDTELITPTYEYIDCSLAEGGIVVDRDVSSPTAAAEATTSNAKTTAAPDSASAAPTTPNGETVTLTSQPVFNTNGDAVVDDSGEPVMMSEIAVMVGNAAADPGETVTVPISISEATGLTGLSISLAYDTEQLTFVDGSCVGFVKDSMSVSFVNENNEGIVSIGATDSQGADGSGVIAELTFKVNKTAKAGHYALSLNPAPEFLNHTIKMPVQTHNGDFHIETDGTPSNDVVVYAVIALALAIVLAAVVWRMAIRKKATPKPSQTTAAVRLDDDISEDPTNTDI